MRYRDLFERMFKTLRVFAPSSSEFIPFLTCHPQDRSARVCNFCENGDYIQDEIFSCIGTEHLRHQFIHFFDNISEGDIKGFVFQHNSDLLVQLLTFLIDLFVGTYRLSSHARLEAFVNQTKLN